MVHAGYKLFLPRSALQCHWHSHLTRLSCTATRRAIIPSSTHPSLALSTTSGNSFNSGNNFSSNRKNYGKYNNYTNKWYGRAFGTLVGAVGSVALLGLGTVLSESLEDRECGSTSDVRKGKSNKTLVKKEDKSQLEESNTETEKESNANYITREAQSWEALGKRKAMQTGEVNSHDLRVKKARQLLKRRMEEVGAPGLVVGVTVNGKQVWADGLGFANLESGVRCSPATVMRIASISKSLTMTAVAKLWEDGKIDLDVPIQKYIPKFPVKTFDGKEVSITTRHLLSHKSGIRHYTLRHHDKDDDEGKKSDESEESECSNDDLEVEKGKESIIVGDETDTEKEKEGKNAKNNECKENIKEQRCRCGRLVSKKRKAKKKNKDDEYDLEEYYITDEFKTLDEALQIFQDDDLFFKPGEGYLYSTHGWTVVSAVVEAAAKKPFTEVVQRLFYELGLDNTYLDRSSPIIYNRASYYIRDEHGKLQNAPYVDNSYKWAGGGFLSTVGDLCKFGNAMLYAFQQKGDGDEEGRDMPSTRGYLKASTVQQLWTPVEGTKITWRDKTYGMGWEIVEEKNVGNFCRNSRQQAYHTGGAIGASSILLILPGREEHGSGCAPEGVVVAIITNMISVSLTQVALEIAQLFEGTQ